jgi:hypothetical protein
MKTLRKGDKGETVEFLQHRLCVHGHYVQQDGDFGPKTEAAVLQFQAAHNLETDCIVGDKTWDALLVNQRETEPAHLLEEQKSWLRQKMHGSGVLNAWASQVLEAAIDDLGKKEVPAGSNFGSEIEHLVDGYNEYWKTGLKIHMPWCAMAVCSWMKIGLKKEEWKDIPLGNWWGGASQLEKWGDKNDRSRTCFAPKIVEPGTIFTMARGSSGSDSSSSAKAGHTGYVVADDGDHVITIEGNVGDKVQSRRRRKDSLRFFITWW